MSTEPPTSPANRSTPYAKSPAVVQKGAAAKLPSPVAAALQAAPASPEDLELQQRIAAYFARIPVVGLRQLRIEVRAGVVTLMGQAANDYERQLAHHYVRRIPGVETFVDSIAVDAPPPPKLGLIDKLRSGLASLRAGLAAPIRKLLPERPVDEVDLLIEQERLAAGQPRKLRVTHPLAFAGVALGLLLIVVRTALSGPDVQESESRLPTYPVKGTVLVGKDAPKGAFVVFHPLSGATHAPHPAGFVTKFGDYSLTTYELGDGAPPGDYLVTLEWKPPTGKKAFRPLPTQVTSTKTTKLRARVTTKGNVISQFKL